MEGQWCSRPQAPSRRQVPSRPALTAQQCQAGLEAVAGALQPQLVIHLRVQVLQRRQRRAVWVAVVPAHQGQAAQEQALVDLGGQGRGRSGTDRERVGVGGGTAPASQEG